MPYQPQPLEDYYDITDKARSGEYFHEARYMYDVYIHDLMSERYLYILITTLSLLSFVVAVMAASALNPLVTKVPFIYNTSDIIEDVPRIAPLRQDATEDRNFVVARYVVKNYVIRHEEYDIASLSRNANSIKNQSSSDVFNDYNQLMDTANPDSPIALYQRHTRRKIDVVSLRKVASSEGDEMEVIYYATVENKTESKKTRWQANITFSYNGVGLDDTGKATPVSFLVTRYRTKRLQDIE